MIQLEFKNWLELQSYDSAPSNAKVQAADAALGHVAGGIGKLMNQRFGALEPNQHHGEEHLGNVLKAVNEGQYLVIVAKEAFDPHNPVDVRSLANHALKRILADPEMLHRASAGNIDLKNPTKVTEKYDETNGQIIFTFRFKLRPKMSDKFAANGMSRYPYHTPEPASMNPIPAPI